MEADEDILIIVDVKNKGTYPTDKGEDKKDFGRGTIYLSGFDDAIIDFDQKSKRIGNDDGDFILFLPGASSFNPLGGFDSAEFEGKIVAEKLTIDEYNPIILATVCYP